MSTLKVHLEPTGIFSTSMVRQARALERYAPPGIEIVKRREQADLQIMHIYYIPEFIPSRYVVMQHCFLTTQWPSAEQWAPFWSGAELVWSHYALPPASIPYKFYRAPLGLDVAFLAPLPAARRDLIVTTGYVTGHPGEAIEEVWSAAEQLGIKGVHLGPPQVEGATRKLPRNWHSVNGISDAELATLYSRALFVGALRYVEGFELPAAEGLACGARPIVFDQPAMHHWYGDTAIYIPERTGTDLVQSLVEVLRAEYPPITQDERVAAINKFDWSVIAEGFWKALLDVEVQA